MIFYHTNVEITDRITTHISKELRCLIKSMCIFLKRKLFCTIRYMAQFPASYTLRDSRINNISNFKCFVLPLGLSSISECLGRYFLGVGDLYSRNFIPWLNNLHISRFFGQGTANSRSSLYNVSSNTYIFQILHAAACRRQATPTISGREAVEACCS